LEIKHTDIWPARQTGRPYVQILCNMKALGIVRRLIPQFCLFYEKVILLPVNFLYFKFEFCQLSI